MSLICHHSRITRLNKDFVRCLSCGQSIVSPVNSMKNKSKTDFIKENNSFKRNFERNFNNVIEEVDQTYPNVNEYYVDRALINKIIIERDSVFSTNPPKYRVNLNGEITVLTEEQIKQLLTNIKATRVDEVQFMKILKN